MNQDQWETIHFFRPEENFGDPTRMSYQLLITLDNFRGYIDVPIIIHCGYETDGHSENSYHYKGMAVDCHAKGIDLYDFYFAATRFQFNGIGIYPWWNSPGLHLDVRPTKYLGAKSFWGSTGPNTYVGLDSKFLSTYLI